ncbi:hypothetical protein J7L09_01675 [bacterium]|nr:hypothetical protein [bacterium]
MNNKSFIEFERAKEEFLKNRPQKDIDILDLAVQIINDLLHGPQNKGFLAWDASSLIEKEAILSGIIRRLGEIQSDLEAKSEWLKVKLKSEEEDLIEALTNQNGKITQKKIERHLAKVQKTDLEKIILLKNQANSLQHCLKAIDKICLAITHRINDLKNHD